jgi:hypothetical protein
MSQLLLQVDILLEQINKQQQPGTGKLIAQNLGASVLPAIVASTYLTPKFKDTLVNKGVSGDPLVKGVENFSKADVGAQLSSSLTGMAAGALGKKLMQKYQEKKYGIMQPNDKRTTGQKVVDTGLNVAQRAASIGSGVATRAALGTALNAANISIAGKAGAALLTGGTGMLAIPAFIAASSLASKPFNAMRQKIQEKRQQSQQNNP